MDRFLLIQTGGTIESTVTDGIADVKGSSVLLKTLLEEAAPSVRVDTVQPLQMLSENLTPPLWRDIAKAVRKGMSDGYKGILITHGSDTLPYTAALLGYLFGGYTKIPIVITAADFPLSDLRSNGRENIRESAACLQTAPPGCYVVWKNPGEKVRRHFATRLAEAGYIRDTFSFYGIEAGDIPCTPPPIPENFSFALPFIFMIKNYPGLDYSALQFPEKKPAAILHTMYHSATGCVTADARYRLPDFVRRMERLGIPVYGLGFKKGRTTYAGVPAVLESGCIPLPLMTAEAALVKLQLVYALCPEAPLPLLHRTWYREVLD